MNPLVQPQAGTSANCAEPWVASRPARIEKVRETPARFFVARPGSGVPAIPETQGLQEAPFNS